MSSNSGKDNASVVDSSVTEEKRKLVAVEDQDRIIHEWIEVWYPPGEPRQLHDQSEVPIAKTNNKCTRYFILESFSHGDIQQSVQTGLWVIQVSNEALLEEAFNTSGKVILIFSINDWCFRGIAQMMSSLALRRLNRLTQSGAIRHNPWCRGFRVKWLRLSYLPVEETLHLVKTEKDCQELPQNIGEALCLSALDEGSVEEDISRSKSYETEVISHIDEPFSYSKSLHNWCSLPMTEEEFLKFINTPTGMLEDHERDSSNNDSFRNGGEAVPQEMAEQSSFK